MRKIGFILGLLIAINSFSKGLDVKVTVKGLENKTAYLGYFYGDKQYIIDTVKLSSTGYTHFKRDTLLPQGVYLFVTDDRRYFEFMLDLNQSFTMKTESPDFVGKMAVTGSDENKKFFEYVNYIQGLSKKAEAFQTTANDQKLTQKERTKAQDDLEEMSKQVEAYRKDFIGKNYSTSIFAKMLKSTAEIDMPESPKKADGSIDSVASYMYYKTHFWDNFDLAAPFVAYTPNFHARFEKFFTEIIHQSPDSIIKETDIFLKKIEPNKELFKYCLHWLTAHYEKSEIMGYDAIFVHLGLEYYNKGRAFWADEVYIMRLMDRVNTLNYTLIGKKGENLILTNDKGKTVSLYNTKAPVTILFFWDSNCGQCQKVTPLINDVYKKYKAQGIKVYSVNIELKKEGWLKAIEEKQIQEWTNVIDVEMVSNFRRFYDVFSSPVVYLLDENKNIIAKRLDPEQMDHFIENRLKELKN